MELSDFAQGVPDEVWRLFEPILPPVVWCGVGRPPIPNRQVLHALLYVLASGISWTMMPMGMPSAKTVRRRLKIWRQGDAFFLAWQHMAQRYQALAGINWDKLYLDGSRKPAKKGARPPAATPPIAANAARA